MSRAFDHAHDPFRRIVSDFLIDKDPLFAELNLAEDELQLYRQLYDRLKPSVRKPDLVIYLQAQPDILIDRAFDMAAVRGADGQVMLLAWHRDRLIRDSWLRSLGVATPVPAAEPGMGSLRGVACDEAGCVVELAGQRVGLAHGVEAAVEDCGRLDLVVARAGPEYCRDGRMIGPRALRASGGIAITQRDGRLVVRTVKESRGDWPWTRPPTALQTYKLNSEE